jgi:hypothetical protein
MDNLPIQYDPAKLDESRKSPAGRRAANAVSDAFDLIGGVPRLAVWADENPTDFYTKIWNRSIQTNQQVEHSGELVIRTAIPRSPLDGEWEEAQEVAK